jgi:hypothetical protein
MSIDSHRSARLSLSEIFFATLCKPTRAYDSAEKPYECFDEAQHERKISYDFRSSSVRPEALEG